MSKLSRLRNLWRGRALERELDEELRFHFEMRVERNLRNGMPRADAEAEARRHMGSALRAREGMREARIIAWLASAGRDVAYAVRGLRRQPGFAAVAILTMALGIGANTAIYSVLQAVWIDAVPFPDPDRLVVIAKNRPWSEFDELRARNRSFVEVAPLQRRAQIVHLTDGPRAVGAMGTTESLFSLLGVTPVIGRAITAADMLPGAEPVVMLSVGFWQTQFGGDPDIVGRPVRVGPTAGLISADRPERLATIIGVMPRDAKLSRFEPELWIPVPVQDRGSPSGRGVDEMVARLRDDASLESAREDVNAILGPFEAARASLIRTGGVKVGTAIPVTRLRNMVVGTEIGQSLFLLLGATAIVLLIACVNVANLFLARGLDRIRESAVRAAIGAGRARLIRQGVIENTVVAGAGCIVAVAIAAMTRDALVAAMPYDVPRADAIAIDWRVLAFSAGLAVCTVMLTGLLPSLRSASVRPVAILTSGGSQTTTTRRRRVGHLLVALEVALSLVVLATAGLLIGSFMRLTATDPGFSPANVAAFRADPSSPFARALPAGTAAQVVDELSRAPDVLAAAITNMVPFEMGGNARGVRVPGQSDVVMAAFRTVSPGYFRTMGMALRSGRDILAADDAGASPVVVVNERTAREFWPGKDAVGQQLQVFGPAPAVVIGVVNDVRPRLAVEPDIEVYIPLSQAPDQVLRFVVRTTTDPLAVVRRLEPRIEQITGNRVSSLTAVDTYIARSVHGPRFRALLFGLMGLLVVVLTAVGVFSVTAHVVAQRHREMGIRMAIGAQARQVARMMVAQTAVPVMVGLGLGLFGALATTTLVARFLYATTPTDPATFVVVLCLVVATSLTAAWLPARRALRIDPLKVLRLE